MGPLPCASATVLLDPGDIDLAEIILIITFFSFHDAKVKVKIIKNKVRFIAEIGRDFRIKKLKRVAIDGSP